MTREFLQWLNKQDDYWIEDKTVEKKFPKLDIEMVGVTKKNERGGKFGNAQTRLASGSKVWRRT